MEAGGWDSAWLGVLLNAKNASKLNIALLGSSDSSSFELADSVEVASPADRDVGRCARSTCQKRWRSPDTQQAIWQECTSNSVHWLPSTATADVCCCLILGLFAGVQIKASTATIYWRYGNVCGSESNRPTNTGLCTGGLPHTIPGLASSEECVTDTLFMKALYKF